MPLPIVLNTTVTTLNQFCCLSHNSKAIIFLKKLNSFYGAMHFSAKRGIAIACRLSLCLSVRLSVRLSVTLMDCDHIRWNTSEIISPLVSLRCSLSADPNIMGLLQGQHPDMLA